MFRHKKSQGRSLKGLVIFLSFAILFLGTLPALAQQEPLEKQLTEAKYTITDQARIIEELRDNFFGTVEELNNEIERLRTLIDQQKAAVKQYEEVQAALEEAQAKVNALKEAQVKADALELQLKQESSLTQRFSKKIDLLSSEIASLKYEKTGLEIALAEKKDTVSTQEYQGKIQGLTKEILSLKKKDAKQEETINQLTNNYFQKTEELNGKIATLKKQNAEQEKSIDHWNEKYFEIAKNLGAEVDGLKKQNTEQKKTIAQLSVENDKQKEAIDRLINNYYNKTEEVSDQIKTLKKQNNDQKRIIAQLNTKIGKQEKTIQSYNKAVRKLGGDIGRLNSQFGPLKAANEELLTENKQITSSSNTLKWLAGVLVVAGFFFAGGGM